MKRLELMKMKKSFVVLTTVLLLSISLWSCLDGGNSRSYANVPAIVVLSNGGMVMLQTSYDVLHPYAAPTLPDSYKPGDYLYVSYTIDFDNQPSSEYLTLTDLRVDERLESSEAIIANGEEAKSMMYDAITYQDSIVDMLSVTCFGGAWFDGFRNKASKTIFDYDMIFNTDSVEPGSNIYSVYILPKNTNEVLNINSEYRSYAFDVENLLYSSYAKDTTVDGVNCRLSRINVYFKSGAKNGKNIFKAYPRNPIMFLLVKPTSGL